MLQHYAQRSVGLAGLLRAALPAIYLSMLAGLLSASGVANGGTLRPLVPSITPKLAQQVLDFDNGDAPLVPTLLRIAAMYHLPMGIERVVPEALEKPVRIQARAASVAELLSLCTRAVPGYSWAPEAGAVVVFGATERSARSNLFNLVIRSFQVRNQTTDETSEKLGRSVVAQVQRPRSIIGSYLENLELEKRRLTFSVRSATLRQVLNEIVALDGETVWMARVPPECLSRLPQGGLWVLVPRSVQDPRGLIDLSGCAASSGHKP